MNLAAGQSDRSQPEVPGSLRPSGCSDDAAAACGEGEGPAAGSWLRGDRGQGRVSAGTSAAQGGLPAWSGE